MERYKLLIVILVVILAILKVYFIRMSLFRA